MWKRFSVCCLLRDFRSHDGRRVGRTWVSKLRACCRSCAQLAAAMLSGSQAFKEGVMVRRAIDGLFP